MPAIPTNLITGFLGVGKTTAVIDLLKHKSSEERWAVLVNEYGDVSIDGALIEGSSPDGVTVREVGGGCVCCASAPYLGVALHFLLLDARPDRLIIETTGLGHPARLLDNLRENYRDRLELRAVLGIIDPSDFAKPEMRDNPVFIDQIQLADVVVMNKLDTATPELVAEFQTWANSLFPPKLLIAGTTHGHLNPAWLDLTASDERLPLFPEAHEHGEHDLTSQPPPPVALTPQPPLPGGEGAEDDLTPQPTLPLALTPQPPPPLALTPQPPPPLALTPQPPPPLALTPQPPLPGGEGAEDDLIPQPTPPLALTPQPPLPGGEGAEDDLTPQPTLPLAPPLPEAEGALSSSPSPSGRGGRGVRANTLADEDALSSSPSPSGRGGRGVRANTLADEDALSSSPSPSGRGGRGVRANTLADEDALSSPPSPSGRGGRGVRANTLADEGTLIPRSGTQGFKPVSSGGKTAEEESQRISELAGRNRLIPEELLKLARELRKEQTTAEQFLWNCLRNRQLENAKFRRQHNLGPYIADFYCHAAQLCIELDGSVHDTPEQKDKDQTRDRWMVENGFRSLRLRNELIVSNPEEALGLIADALGAPLSPALTPQPPLPEGEEEDDVTLEPPLSPALNPQIALPEGEEDDLTPQPPPPLALTPQPPLPGGEGAEDDLTPQPTLPLALTPQPPLPGGEGAMISSPSPPGRGGRGVRANTSSERWPASDIRIKRFPSPPGVQPACCGWIFPANDLFDEGKLLALLGSTRGISRLKGVFRLADEWATVNRVGEALTVAPTAYRRDSRLEAFAEQLDWLTFEQELLNCLVR